jgi:hypothetical protein
MTKYKIVGIIDLFFGIPQFLISIIFPLSVFPKLSQMYADFNVNSQLNLTSGYVVALLIFIIAITNIFLGIKGLTISKEKEKYFKYGIISAVATFFLTGILVAILNFSIISPIYNLTSQF